MGFQFSPLVIPLLVAAGLHAALGVYALRRRSAPGQAYSGPALAGVTFAIAFWSIGYLFELSSADLPTKLFFSNVSFLGIVTTPTAWLVFALIYSGHRHWLNRRSLALLSAAPLLTLTLVWTNAWHNLFWVSIALRQHGAYATLDLGFGPGFYFHTVYSYLLMLFGAILIVREQISAPRLFWGQRLTLLLGLLLPWLASVLNLLNIPPWDALDPTPFVFILTGLALAWSVFGFRLLAVAPLARQDVMDNLADGLLVLDLSGRLVDCNQAAGRILQTPLQPKIGQPAEKLFNAWPELKAVASGKVERMEWSAPGPTRAQQTAGGQTARQLYDVSGSPVLDARRSPVGRMVTLHAIPPGFQTALAQVENSLAQRTAHLQALSQVVEVCSQAKDLPDVLAAALDQALNALQSEIGGARFQEHIIHRGLDEPRTEGWLPALDRLGLLQQLAAQPYVCLQAGPALEQEAALEDLHTLLFVPAHVFGQLTGWLGVFSVASRSWTQDEIALLQAVARQVSLVSERLTSAERARQYTELISRLVSYSEELNYSLTEEEALAAICQGARSLVNPDRVDVQLLSPAAAAQAEPGANQADASPEAPLQNPGSAPRPRAVLVSDVRQQLAAMDDPQVQQAIDYQALGIWPLVYQGQTLAMLRCYYDQPHTWSETEQEVMQAFSRQAAVSLESTRLFAAERRQRGLAETLHEVAVQLSASLDLSEVLERTFHSLERVLAYDLAHILILEAGRARLVHSHGFTGVELEKLEAGLQQIDIAEIPGMSGVSDSLQPFLLSDTREDSAWSTYWKATRARSYLAVPVVRQGELIALFNLFSRQPGYYTPQQVYHLQAIANQVSVAAQNAFLYRSQQKQAAETTALYRSLSRLFNPGGDVRQVAEQIAQAVLEEFPDVYASVMVADEAGKELKILAWKGYPMLADNRLWLDGPGLTVSAYHRGETIYIPDVCLEPRYVTGANQTCSELVLPLVVRRQVIGVLNLEHPLMDAFDESARRVLSAFAEHAAFALENALLFETASLQLRQLNLLNEITRISLAEVGFNAMLQQVADRTRDLFNADDCFITLWDDDHQHVIPGVVSGKDSHVYGRVVPNPGEPTITGHVLETGQILAIEDVAATSHLSPRIGGSFSVVSVLGVPLIANQQKFGAAILGYQLRRHFSEREIALGEQAGGQIALAIARARLLELSQRRAREAENLRLASEALTGTLDLAQVLPNILKHLARVIPFDSAAVFLLEPEGIRAVSAVGPPEMSNLIGQIFPAENPLVTDMLEGHRPLILADAQAEKRFANWGGVSHIHGWMGVPLVSQGKSIGFLTIDSRKVNAFDSEQSRMAQAFVNQVAIAIETASLFDEVQRLAVTDPLTGLLNRRGYTELGRREIERTRRYKRPLAAIMLDIDHFKQINDQFKHATGDEVLRELAARCRERMREIDILGRYGGEEFVLLLPETDLKGALRAAESLRERISRVPFRTQAGALKVTISLGVAVYSSGEMDLEKLLDHADDAMYVAKQSGRNQVRAFDLPK